MYKQLRYTSDSIYKMPFLTLPELEKTGRLRINYPSTQRQVTTPKAGTNAKLFNKN